MTHLLAGPTEELFVVDPKAPKEINIDVLTCNLTRARAIVGLISCSGEDTDHFLISHGLIIEGLWALDGILNQTQQMVDHASFCGNPGVEKESRKSRGSA